MKASKEFIETIINALGKGDIEELENNLNNINKDNFLKSLNYTSEKKLKEKIENTFYIGLSNCIESRDFENFRELLDYSVNFDIFFDVKKIPNRLEITTDLLFNSLNNIDLAEIIEILRFSNKNNLFEKDFSKEEIKKLKEIKRDKLLLANFEDLFGEITNSFILFIYKVMPQNLYDFFRETMSFYSFSSNDDFNVNYVLNYLDQYSIYGLSVKLLGEAKRFFNNFNNTLKTGNSTAYKDELVKKYKNFDLVDFDFANKTHLASSKNLLNLKNKIHNNDDYKFYNLSMVLLGGLGPQGHGFTYSTPKGEVVEICSDIKETDAIIIKYKQFLKQQFVTKLELELKNSFQIDNIIRDKIIKYLLDVLDQNELISFNKKERILKHINEFLNQNQTYLNYDKLSLRELIDRISNAINIILRKIKMEDQFITRMELISQNKLKSEDIAKLTSLKKKSHYDVLRERFFFQYIVDWFYEIYLKEKSEQQH